MRAREITRERDSDREIYSGIEREIERERERNRTREIEIKKDRVGKTEVIKERDRKKERYI